MIEHLNCTRDREKNYEEKSQMGVISRLIDGTLLVHGILTKLGMGRPTDPDYIMTFAKFDFNWIRDLVFGKGQI